MCDNNAANAAQRYCLERGFLESSSFTAQPHSNDLFSCLTWNSASNPDGWYRDGQHDGSITQVCCTPTQESVAATGVEPPRRYSADTKGSAAQSPGPYDLDSFSCSEDHVERSVQSDMDTISIVGCSEDPNKQEFSRILPKPGLYADEATATVSLEAPWHRVGYVDTSHTARNVTVYVRASMTAVTCGKRQFCFVGSVADEKTNICGAPACPNPFAGASGPLESSCVCEGNTECKEGEMCTSEGTCVAGCPSTGERTSRRCLCSRPGLNATATPNVWCESGYACDHQSATCALHVCPNGDGSAVVEAGGCVCTGSKFSEVCHEGTYCMADAQSRWEGEVTTLCQQTKFGYRAGFFRTKEPAPTCASVKSSILYRVNISTMRLDPSIL